VKETSLTHRKLTVGHRPCGWIHEHEPQKTVIAILSQIYKSFPHLVLNILSTPSANSTVYT